MPIRTYIDIAAGIVVLLFLWWVFHEGERRIEDADARAVAAQVIHNEEVNRRAQSAIAAAEELYRTKYAAPPLAPVHVSVCHAPGASAVSSTPAGAGGSDAAADIPPAVGHEGDDIGPYTDHLLDQADAQIEALQAIIRAQQEQMENAHGKDRRN
jgi:hypothetical protein